MSLEFSIQHLHPIHVYPYMSYILQKKILIIYTVGSEQSLRDYTEKHLSFQHQAFVRFLLPSSKHQSSVPSGVSFSLRSLVHLMSNMAIVCLGLLCLWWAAMSVDPHKRQTDVSHMCFHLHLLTLFFFIVPPLCFIITGVSFSIIASPVRSQRSHLLCTDVLWRELALYILVMHKLFFYCTFNVEICIPLSLTPYT